MRSISPEELESVDGGLIRTLAGGLLYDGVKWLVNTALAEPHSNDDRCDYYDNMPAGVQ